MKLKFKPLLSFAPLLLLPGLFAINGNIKKHEDHRPAKKMADNIAMLPCGFPSRGIVSGEGAMFYTNNSKPILYSNASVFNQYPDVPSSVFVGNNELRLQSDGNLVIYESGVNCWDSGTGARPTNHNYALWFQGDGNLVLRDGNTVLWASNIYSTCSGSEYAYADFQSDGNFVIQYPHDYQGVISDPAHINVDSYQLGTTHTNGGLHNSSHKIY